MKSQRAMVTTPFWAGNDDGTATFFANGDLKLIESINLGNGGEDTIQLDDGTNTVIAGAKSDVINIGGGTNFVFADEGRREVTTTNIIAESLNAAVGGKDQITVGPGYNVIAGGADEDTITVNGTAASARGIVLGDNGEMTLDLAGNLLEITSTEFASGAKDIITLTSGTNAIIGGAGNDEITAGNGHNTILGDDGTATFFANGDLELIESINLGNGGIDTIQLDDGTNTVIAGAKSDVINIGGGTNFVFADEGRREVTATNIIAESLNAAVGGKDQITVGPGYNVIAGGADEDTITVNGTAASARGIVLGDNGEMTLDLGGNLLEITSTEFASGAKDIITLTSGTNAIIGGAGNDEITAGDGHNTILGDDGTATFFANGDLKLIESINLGNGGTDTIQLDDGTNTVIAGAKSDIINIGGGTNFVFADEGRREVTATNIIAESLNAAVGGKDQITVGPGYNVIAGGADEDTITVNGTAASARGIVLGDNGEMTLDLAGNLLEITSTEFASGAKDIITLTSGTNAIIGGAGNDEITAGNGHNTILGDDGTATFFANGDLKLIESINLGNGGEDTIQLNNGQNAVIAGALNDIVTIQSGTNVVLGDEGRREVLTDAFGTPTGIVEIQSLNPSVGGSDTISVGPGRNTILGGANSDVISVNGTTPGSRSAVLGDNGYMTMTVGGTLLSIQSNAFASGASDDIDLVAGTNAVIGGTGADDIDAAGGTNTILGDDGIASFFNSGEVQLISSLNPGNGGNDDINVLDGTNRIIAGAGLDTITMGNGTNVALGDEGEYRVNTNSVGMPTGTTNIQTTNPASGGNDTINAADGYNIVVGGQGTDKITVNGTHAGSRGIVLGDNGAMTLSSAGLPQDIATTSFVSGANDVITLTAGVNTVIAGVGADSITISDGHNTVFGDDAAGQFFTSGRLDSIESINLNSGDSDTILVNNGTNTIVAGAAADDISVVNGTNLIVGDEAEADFHTDGTNDVLQTSNSGFGASDQFTLQSGHNFAIGGAGGDFFTVHGGVATILGDEGQRTISRDGAGPISGLVIESLNESVGAGDNIFAIGGQITAIAGAASDTISGTDFATAPAPKFVALGDSGRAEYDAAFELVEIFSTAPDAGTGDTIHLASANDIVIGGAGQDDIQTGRGNNLAFGDNAHVMFAGGIFQSAHSTQTSFGDHDTITGGIANDTLIGGVGRDELHPLAGQNIALGDNGQLAWVNGIVRTVQTSDFNSGDADRIHLTAGTNFVAGGLAGDEITAANSVNSIMGDEGFARFYANGGLQSMESIHSGVGGLDSITITNGINHVIAGAHADTVTIHNGTNLVLGDEGEALLWTDGTVDEFRTTNSGVGAADTVTLNNGTNVAITGAANDAVLVHGGDAIVLSDEGQRVVSRDAGGTVSGLFVETLFDSVGASDSIAATSGTVTVMAGSDADTIHGTNTSGLPAPKFIALGDAGRANYGPTAQLLEVFSKSPFTGTGDTISLAAGNDIVIAGAGNDTVSTGSGNNAVFGDNARVTFDSSGVSNLLQSLDIQYGGHDTVTAGPGNDTVIGGVGRDAVTIPRGRNLVVGDNGRIDLSGGIVTQLQSNEFTTGDVDTINIANGTNLVIGGLASDHISAAAGTNTIFGDDTRATFFGNGDLHFAESINLSSGGLDHISAIDGTNTIVAGANADTVSITDGTNYVLTDEGEAIFFTDGTLDEFRTTNSGIGGDDTITALDGNNVVIAGAARDSITTHSGTLVVLGDEGQRVVNRDAFNNVTDIIVETQQDVTGDSDSIVAHGGKIIGMAGAANDTVRGIEINPAAPQNPEFIVTGDSGRAEFDPTLQVREFFSTSPGIGGIDLIELADAHDFVIGGAFADIIHAANGNNTVASDNAHASFDANGQLRSLTSTATSVGGNDTVTTGLGHDTVFGGYADDDITAIGGSNVVMGDNAQVTVDTFGQLLNVASTATEHGGADTIQTGIGADWILGGKNSDTIRSTDGNNLILGDNGELQIDGTGILRSVTTSFHANGTYDVITTGPGNDIVLGSSGSDIINITDGNNLVLGDNGSLSYNATGQLNLVSTSDITIFGNDSVTTGPGNDTILGGSGRDSVAAADGNNIILGDNARAEFVEFGQLIEFESIEHYAGDADVIRAGIGNDIVIGGFAADDIETEAGNNILIGDNAELIFDADGHLDAAQTNYADIGDNDTIVSGPGNDVVFAGAGRDQVTISNGRNVIAGDHAAATFDPQHLLRTITSIDVSIGDNDTISSGLGNDVVLGGQANDVVTAGSGNNVVLGDSGHAEFDAVRTLLNITSQSPSIGGADTITAATGNDIVVGGTAGDAVTIQGGHNIVIGDNARATANAGGIWREISTIDTNIGGQDTIFTGVGNDLIYGGIDNDTLSSTGGSNIVAGDNAIATFNDLAEIVNASTIAFADGGEDTIATTSGDDIIFGGSASDQIAANSGDNIVTGDNATADFNSHRRMIRLETIATDIGDNDTISSHTGNDIVFGGTANDTVTTTGGDNIIVGDNGSAVFNNDAILQSVTSDATAHGGLDTITSAAGHDTIFGGSFADTIDADSGNNIVVGDNAEADFNANRLAIRVQTIDPSVGDDDTISTLTGNDIVFGGTANDTVTTTGGDNIIVGDNGSAIFNSDAILQSVTSDATAHGGLDTITSAAGHDTIFGGSFADTIDANRRKQHRRR